MSVMFSYCLIGNYPWRALFRDFLYDLEQEKLEIVRLLHAPEDGVVGALLARFDLPNL